ncbi:MAG: glycoside hydrolase family 66 protein [Actinomycetota bacterium]
MTIVADRATFLPAEPVGLAFEPPLDEDQTLIVWRLAEEVLRVPLAAGTSSVDLGTLPLGGYGVSVGEQTSAFDVLADPFDRPRYGFVVAMTEDVDRDALSRYYRRLHLNVAQFYDWAYRHSVLVAPQDSYVDPLGQVRTLTGVNAIARALTDGGTAPLAYTAVYGVGHDEEADWRDSLLLRADGEAYRFGDDFLLIVDPAGEKWMPHYLEQLATVIEKTALVGFHLDQYGWPKFARRTDGSVVDLTESFVTLLGAIRERLPKARFIFNNVNDFPTYATAVTPQDATYIEVWDPHSGLGDLGALATKARSYRPEHPPILSAYLSCYSDGDEHRANNAARLVMASIFSHGASHLLLGESSNVLVHAYYPNNRAIGAESVDMFVRWYDFLVRYGDLLMHPEQVDVTEEFTGGVNDEFVFESDSGVRFSTKAEPGTVWTRVVRTSHGFVVHLINLVAQTETVWDATKNDPVPLSGLRLRYIAPTADPVAYSADPDGHPGLRPIAIVHDEQTGEVDRLSGAQASVLLDLPTLGTWTVLYFPSAG